MAQEHASVTSLAERMVVSDGFETLFKTGMKLVEDTAQYLDGQGRRDSRELKGAVKYAYSNETMKLTNVLMKYARWLLLHRTVKDGERTLEDCGKESVRVPVPPAFHVARFADMPKGLQDLLVRADAVGKDMRRLDAMFHSSQ